MIHDMIPEIFKLPKYLMWIQKDLAIKNASQFITISNTTTKDLKKFYPHIHNNSKIYPITLIYNSIPQINLTNSYTIGDTIGDTKYDNNFVNNAPIVLKEIGEADPFQENLPPEQDSFLKNFSKNPNIQNALDEVNKVTKVNKMEQNKDPANIPPVYVKQQNGETDFKNGDVINNIESIPQFVN
jgi:hypothetical protein